MNASEFQAGRNTQLTEFQKQYTDLKSQYSSAVVNALKEQDRPRQCMQIKQALDTNKRITALLKSFRGTVDPGTCKANPNLKPTLQADLEKYNKQYEEIQQGQDQLSGLKYAIEQTKEKTKDIREQFSWYFVLLVVSVLALLFIVLFRSTSSSIFNTEPSMPVLSTGE